MLKKLEAARIAAIAVLTTTLAQALPALAGGNSSGSQDSIVTPGYGTLGGIFDWLLRLFS